MKLRVLNDAGVAWARRLKKKDLQFSKEETHPCQAARAFIRRDGASIPHLILECQHGGRATRSIDFKYRGQGWRE